MANIYDTANQLEKEIRTSTEYKNVETALIAVNADIEAKKTYDEFVALQQQLQEKMSNGEQMTADDQGKIQEFQVKLQENPLLTSLMTSEQTLQVLINDIQQIVLKPLQDLYQPNA